MLLGGGAASSQGAAPPSSGGEAVAAPKPPAPDPYQPGFLDALGRWFGNSKAKLDEGIKSTQDAIKNTQDAFGDIGTRASGAAKGAAGAAQEVTGSIVALPGTRIVSGREPCGVAANGAPDCTSAATTLCRAKGFGSGRGLDVNSAQKCPARVWWSGRQPAEGECKTETFVLRAMCQ